MPYVTRDTKTGDAGKSAKERFMESVRNDIENGDIEVPGIDVSGLNVNHGESFSSRPTRFVGQLCIGPRKGDWFAGSFDSDTYGSFKVTGNTEIDISGARCVIVGKWVEHQRFGVQFKIESIKLEDPGQAEQLWLSSGVLKGIGPVLAQTLITKFGQNDGSIFDHFTRDELMCVNGVGPVNVEWILDSYAKNKVTMRAASFGLTLGLSLRQSKKAYELWGDGMRERIEQRPYDLTMIDGVSFAMADKVAQSLGHPRTSPDRYTAGTVEVLRKMTSMGHTCIPTKQHPIYKEAVWPELRKLLGNDTDRELWKKIITDEQNDEGRRVEVIFEDDRNIVFLADKVLYEREKGIADNVQKLLKGMIREVELTDEDIAELAKPIVLADQQLEAVRLALSSPVMILTGGPGTGKTTVTKTIIKALLGGQLTIGCCAPTGKAAVRMKEATGMEACTIHRFLDWRGGFHNNHSRPVDFDVVICDETSMVDTNIAHALIDAVKVGTRLILVGDADQLPSVGPGQVFRDLIDSKVIPTVRLTKIHRQAEGSGIIVNAHALNNGRDLKLEGWSDFAWRDVAGQDEMIDDIAKVMPKLGLDAVALVPYRRHMYELNERLQRIMNGNRPVQFGKKLFLAVGDPVRHTKNNYDIGVFNGEVGVIVAIMTDEELAMWKESNSEWDDAPSIITVKYPDRIVGYPKEYVEELILAYAITIHSSQGSEYDTVVFGCPVMFEGFMKRELPYTAITRGKRAVIVVGEREALKRYKRAKSRAYRHTQLKRMLVPDERENDVW